jgi:hypothetical protein
VGFASRKPTSNDPPQDNSENPWGSQNPCYDDFAVLLNGAGKRCHGCGRVILNEYLKYKNGKAFCPDCV